MGKDKAEIVFKSYAELIEHMRGVYYTRYNIQLDDETLRLIIRMNELEKTVNTKISELAENEIIHYKNIDELIIVSNKKTAISIKNINSKIEEISKIGNKNTMLLLINLGFLAVLLILYFI